MVLHVIQRAGTVVLSPEGADREATEEDARMLEVPILLYFLVHLSRVWRPGPTAMPGEYPELDLSSLIFLAILVCSQKIASYHGLSCL